jgi:hypothetical protein
VKYLLGLTSFALIAILVLQWRDWPPRVEPASAGDELGDTATTAIADPQSPLELLEPPLEKEQFTGVTERPLFRPDRRPPAETPEEAEPPQETTNIELDSLDLAAIIETPEESFVMIRFPSNQKLQRLRVGQEEEGWTLKAIKGDEIELERQGKTDTLVLRNYSKSPPPAARRPARPSTASRTEPQPRPGARQPRNRRNAQRPQERQ